MTTIVEKSFHVVARPNNVGPDGRTIKVSRSYHVREAAEEFAELFRKTSKYPGTVEVVTRRGVDDL